MVTIPGKTRSIGFRLDDQTLKALEERSLELKMNKGQLLLHAFQGWMSLQHEKKTRNMMMVPKFIFQELVELLDEEQISHLARNNAENFKILFKFDTHIESAKKSPINPVQHFLASLELAGMNWFLSTEYTETPEGHCFFRGIHNLSVKTSFYFKTFVSTVLEQLFKYRLVETSHTAEVVQLEFVRNVTNPG